MDILSIIYIVILVLFFIIGLKKGLAKALVSLFRWIAAIAVAGLTSKFVASVIRGFGFVGNWQTKLTDYFNGLGGVYTEQFTDASVKTWAEQFNLPSFVESLIEKVINLIKVEGETSNFSEVLSKSIVYYGSLVIAFILIFIAVIIVLGLLSKFFIKLEDASGLIKFTNRLLGAALYVAIAIIIIGSANYLFAFLISKGGNMGTWLSNTMKLNEDTWTLSKFVYEKNIIGLIISWIQSILIK